MRVVCLILVTGCSFSTTVDPSSDPSSEPGADAATAQPSCDLDGDGTCDDQTWRCGQPPSGPGADPLFGDTNNEALWAHDVSIASKGRFVVAVPGKSLALQLRYDWRVDCPGSTCQAQVEVGLVAAGVDQPLGCIVDRQMADRNIEWSQNGNAKIVVPSTPGVYDVRLEIAKQTACASTWATPASNHTVAKICVP